MNQDRKDAIDELAWQTTKHVFLILGVNNTAEQTKAAAEAIRALAFGALELDVALAKQPTNSLADLAIALKTLREIEGFLQGETRGHCLVAMQVLAQRMVAQAEIGAP